MNTVKNKDPGSFDVPPCLLVNDDEKLNTIVEAIDVAASTAAPLYKIRAYTDIMNVAVVASGDE